jgi:hypothetical protein
MLVIIAIHLSVLQGLIFICWKKQVDTGGTTVKNTFHSVKTRILFCRPHRTQRVHNSTYGCIVKLFVLETVCNFVLVLCVLGFCHIITTLRVPCLN